MIYSVTKYQSEKSEPEHQFRVGELNGPVSCRIKGPQWTFEMSEPKHQLRVGEQAPMPPIPDWYRGAFLSTWHLVKLIPLHETSHLSYQGNALNQLSYNKKNLRNPKGFLKWDYEWEIVKRSDWLNINLKWVNLKTSSWWTSKWFAFRQRTKCPLTMSWTSISIESGQIESI